MLDNLVFIRDSDSDTGAANVIGNVSSKENSEEIIVSQ
jgi:hypothetical protein